MRADRPLRGRILHRRVDDVTLTVSIMMADPRHGEGQAVFVTALRCEVKKIVRAEQEVSTTCIAGVGMEDVAGCVLVENTDAWKFFGWGSGNVIVIVVHVAPGYVIFRERDVIVEIEVGSVR